MTATLFHEWWNSPAAPFWENGAHPYNYECGWALLWITFHELVWCSILLILKSSLLPPSNAHTLNAFTTQQKTEWPLANIFLKSYQTILTMKTLIFQNSIFALTLFFKQEDFNAGSLCVCILPRWRGAEKPKEEQWGHPEYDNNSKSLPPSNRETREEVQKESLGAYVCCWKLEPWRVEPPGRCSCFWRCHPVRNEREETPNLILSSHHPSPASDSR